ncbi:penicillin-binding protein, 1A family [compost metagenome]
MQVIRVITDRYERTLIRKLVEIYLAIRLTKIIPKDELPKIYLYIAYYGWRMNGLKQALNTLKIDINNISINEAASIVARLKYPEPKNKNTTQSIKISNRATYIISRLKKTSPFLPFIEIYRNGSL